MRGTGGTLRVRNLAQKVLWENELSGQISDGCWENANPQDHWEAWCDATVVVDPDHLGRDFYARRDSYGFNVQSNLLYIDCIRDRMLEYVRVATGDASYDLKALRKDLADLQKIIKLRVPMNTPVPAQPRPRKAKLIVEGYAQEFTVYRAVDDDPKAVATLEERDRENAAYRIKRLEEKYAAARAAADKVSLELEAERAKLATV